MSRGSASVKIGGRASGFVLPGSAWERVKNTIKLLDVVALTVSYFYNRLQEL
jgi:hypothetical protein